MSPRGSAVNPKVALTGDKMDFSLLWLELGDENITFSDELDFNPEELDSVYDDVQEEV